VIAAYPLSGEFGRPSANSKGTGAGLRRGSFREENAIFQEFFMTNAMCEAMTNPMMNVFEQAEPNELVKCQLVCGQLVRGQEECLVERVGPLVRERNVTLDLACVDRIDAAGIAALVTLYTIACESGHRFRVTNVSSRVAQILAVVRLDRILLSHNAVRSSDSGSRGQRPAA
jgi:anti-anti-sigma factor